MYTFGPREDGYLALHEPSGKAVASIDTQTVSLTDHVDGDPAKPKLAMPQRLVAPLPREKWRIHFTSYRFAPDELAAFAAELAALKS